VIELRCTYDPATRGGDSPDGRRVKGTLHWVSAEHAYETEVRLYDHLLDREDPSDLAEGEDWKDLLNPDSLETLTGCQLEPSLKDAEPGSRYQFERLGYFCADASDSKPNVPVFNRSATLRDAWAKIRKQNENKPKGKKK
jgi:glutaminyl-tRNA synthetase